MVELVQPPILQALRCMHFGPSILLVSTPLHNSDPPAAWYLLQVGFKRVLVKEVAAFVQDAQAFRRDWEANGPMVPGLDPMEAVDRLKKFQQMFEVSRTGSQPPRPCG